MKPYVLITLLSFFLSCNTKNQAGEADSKGDQASVPVLQVYLEEFDISFYPDSCAGKDSILLPGDEGQLLTDIYDCKGRMKIRQLDKFGRLAIEGEYENSIDTLKKYAIGKSAIDGSREISVRTYFQPLASGTWVYYKDGKEIARKTYKHGILIDPVN